MQTFLPYPNFTASVMCLDYKRLGKQRSEAQQMINAIQRVRNYWGVWTPLTAEEYQDLVKRTNDDLRSTNDKPVGWASHSATVPWRNHVEALMLYRDVAITEWVRRGYNNTMHRSFWNDRDEPIPAILSVDLPDWIGDERVHASHRSNLLRKDTEFYSQYGWSEGPDLEYHWPT